MDGELAYHLPVESQLASGDFPFPCPPRCSGLSLCSSIIHSALSMILACCIAIVFLTSSHSSIIMALISKLED
jgi:hypothetical protein